MDPFKIFTFQDGRKLELHHDESPENPRQMDNMGVLALFHNRYDIGDEGHGLDPKHFDGWNAMGEHIVKELGGSIVLPVRMYDHSGIGFAMGEEAERYPFNCPWDSMQVGFMFVTTEKLIKEYGDDSADSKDKAIRCMQAELEVYNQYHAGDVCGFILRDKPCEHCDGEGEVVDSCWGFWGTDPMTNGIAENLDESLRVELETLS